MQVLQGHTLIGCALPSLLWLPLLPVEIPVAVARNLDVYPSPPVYLERIRLSTQYQKQVVVASTALHIWCRDQCGFYYDLNDKEHANSLLVSFVQHCFEHDLHFDFARHAVLAVRTFHPDLKSNIRRAWDVVSSWRKRMPVPNRLPLPLKVLHGLFFIYLEVSLTGRLRSALWLIIAVVL